MSLELFEPLVNPTAAQMNALDAALDALDGGSVGGVAITYPAQHWNGSGSAWMFRRKFRWLAYDGSGTLSDPLGVGDDVSLSDAADPGVANILDLTSVGWLALGRFYQVTGCTWAVEVETPLGE